MISAGMDLGTQRVKVVILKDKQIIGKSQQFSGFEPTKAAEQAL
ncbi:CoA activase, partial [Candidatus Bathyarchaeota archaeon]